jgi:fluoroquinolone transport system permease protein
MIRKVHIKNDLRQVLRDSVMASLLMAPLLIIVVFKLLLVFLIPAVADRTGFDITLWYPWVMSFVIILNAGMLGIVTGFMMLDDKDGNIAELMAVTPLGRSGYLLNRLSFASGLGMLYTFLAFYVLGIVSIDVFSVILLSLLLAVYSATIGLLLFSGAENKVKGLTFSKALNLLILFAFADLFSLKWFTVIAWFFPPYWISQIILYPFSFQVVAIAVLVHIGWLGMLIAHYYKSAE